MSKLNFSDIFTAFTGVILLGYSVFEIGRMIAGANMTTNEIMILGILTVINSVNMIHRTPGK
jgi:hypothetical protein